MYSYQLLASFSDFIIENAWKWFWGAVVLSLAVAIRDTPDIWRKIKEKEGRGKIWPVCNLSLHWLLVVVTTVGAISSQLGSDRTDKHIGEIDPLNKPILAVTATAKFRVKGDVFATGPITDGANIAFGVGTNSAGIQLKASHTEIAVHPIIPRSPQNADERDIIIKFHEAGEWERSFWPTIWGIDKRAEFFKSVDNFTMGMQEMGTNVHILRGTVSVAVNASLGWSFPIPPQRQKFGATTGEKYTNAAKKIEWRVRKTPIADMTGKHVDVFDGK